MFRHFVFELLLAPAGLVPRGKERAFCRIADDVPSAIFE